LNGFSGTLAKRDDILKKKKNEIIVLHCDINNVYSGGSYVRY